MARDKLSPSGYAVLGLLDRAPAAGYELGTIALGTIAHFWPLTRTHIYGELNRLEGLGLVVSAEVAQKGRPDKRVYSVTAPGRQALEDWLNGEELTPERNRIPILVKLFFAHRMRPDRLAALLSAHRERAQAERDAFAAIVDELAEQYPDEVFSRITALFGVRQLDAMLGWLTEVDDLLGQRPQRPQQPQRRRRAASTAQ